MLMTKIIGTVMVSALVTAGSAFAGDVQAPAKMPNVVVVKTHLDKNGVQTSEDASMIPLTVDLKKDSQGKVDYQQLVKDTQAQLDQSQSIPLKSNQTDSAPDAVKQVFQQADQGSSAEHLNWRWWNNWGNGGFYGYGYYPYYGYYNSYYPYYGYYSNGYTYPYSYGYYYPYNNYGYYYYYY